MKLGRNEPCPCGSGKKYKKCCLANDELKAREERNQLDNRVFDDLLNDPEFLTYNEHPELSKEENLIVEEWWTIYKELKDPDSIRQHLEVFIQNHHGLVDYLGLEEEVLFELGQDYRRENRPGEYIDLLHKMREEFPETYSRSAGYYEFDIIAYLIGIGQLDQIREYFKYFIEDPTEFIDQLYDLVVLLMAVDARDHLLDLVHQVNNKLFSAPDYTESDQLLSTITYDTLANHIQINYSDQNVEDFSRELSEKLFNPSDFEEIKKHWAPRFADITKPYGNWLNEIDQPSEEFYFRLSDQFMRFLNENYKLSWISAMFYSGLVFEYTLECFRQMKTNKNRKPFDFSEKRMDHVVAKLSKQDFIFYDITMLIGTLNSIHYFTKFLVVCKMLEEQDMIKIQQNVKKIYDQTYPDLKVMGTEAFSLEKFPLWD